MSTQRDGAHFRTAASHLPIPPPVMCRLPAICEADIADPVSGFFILRWEILEGAPAPFPSRDGTKVNRPALQDRHHLRQQLLVVPHVGIAKQRCTARM